MVLGETEVQAYTDKGTSKDRDTDGDRGASRDGMREMRTALLKMGISRCCLFIAQYQY